MSIGWVVFRLRWWLFKRLSALGWWVCPEPHKSQLQTIMPQWSDYQRLAATQPIREGEIGGRPRNPYSDHHGDETMSETRKEFAAWGYEVMPGVDGSFVVRKAPPSAGSLREMIGFTNHRDLLAWLTEGHCADAAARWAKENPPPQTGPTP